MTEQRGASLAVEGPAPVAGGTPLSRLAALRHRHDIQGLRAVAVLLVVLNHAGVRVLSGGYVGVDVFFVLSGFLITQLLLADAAKNGRVSMAQFYVRRAKRILPAATLTLVATMVASYCLLNYVRAKQAIVDSVWASVFLANVRMAKQDTDYFERGQPPSPVQHFWSLSVEEQFYFVWPSVLAVTLFGIALRPRRTARAGKGIAAGSVDRLLLVIGVVAAASLAWSIHLTGASPSAAYFATTTRIWELAIGAALALVVVRLAGMPRSVVVLCGWLGLAAIAAASIMFSTTTAFPGYAALLPTVGAALVIAAGISPSQPSAAVSRLLATRVLRYVGDRSYAWYLWHWPVLVIAVQYVGHPLSVAIQLLLVAGAFVLSIVTYRYFEDPIRRAHWRLSRSAVLVPASAAAVACVALITLSSIDNKILHVQELASAAETPAANQQFAVQQTARVAVLPPVIAAVKASRQGAKIPVALTPPVDKLLAPEFLYQFPDGCVPVTDAQTTSKLCRLGDANGLKSIVVFGDSHMQMWMPPILAMAQRDGWAVIPIVKSGCVPSTWVGDGFPGTRASVVRQCHSWFAWAKRQAKAQRPDVTIMSGCCGGVDGSTAAETKQAYLALTAAVKGVSKSVLVLGDNEGIDRQPVDCLLGRNATMKTCTSNWPPQRFAFNDSLAALAKAKGYGFLSTRGWFCYQGSCPMVVGNTVVYRDTGHITLPYAMKLAPPFRSEFRRCILDACAR